MMLRHGIGPTVTGVVGGRALSGATAVLMTAVYPATAHAMVPAYLLLGPVLFAIVLLAAYVPARRASHIDPLASLRAD